MMVLGRRYKEGRQPANSCEKTLVFFKIVEFTQMLFFEKRVKDGQTDGPTKPLINRVAFRN